MSRASRVLTVFLFILLFAAPGLANVDVEAERKLPPTVWTEAGLSGRVAWTAAPEEDYDVYFIDLHRGERGNVYAREGDYSSPALSPDGHTTAFIAEDEDWRGIMLVHLGPKADNRCPVRLNEVPEIEDGLSWSTDCERIYYYTREPADLAAVALFFDPEIIDPSLLERIGKLYYSDAVTGDVISQSLEPGDYFWPRHLGGFGVVCARREWEEDALRRLAYTHDAGVTSDIETPGDEVVGQIKRYPDDTLLIPVMRDGELWYVRFEPRIAEIIAEAPAPPGFYHPVPDPVDAYCGWYLCQTAPAGDPNSELVFVRGLLGECEWETLPLTDNDYYDGEPSWSRIDMGQ